METLIRARIVLEKAEQELRQLLSEAAAAGEYDCLVTLADWAKQLAAMPESLRSTNNGSTASIVNMEASLPLGRPRIAPRRGSRRPPGRKSRKDEYPKFLREKNELVKIGWSRSEKSPYEHKAPKSVVDLLAQALITTGRGGRRFTTDEILPLRQASSDGEVPSYQAYLALAWFRVEGLVTQHGRQGYSLPQGMDLTNEAERRWDNLPAR